MRWLLLVLLFAVVTSSLAEPEPKKYKQETKTNTSLTEDEQKFLREVEEKFGIKSPVDIKVEDNAKVPIPTLSPQQIPAVIAIEIVNDTDTKGKGKRTVDANLGYGYKTNGGYQYRYFGKPTQDKGKFMIYPYSQEDIPSPKNYHSSSGNGDYSQNGQVTNVEIHASHAFELKEVGDDNSYHYDKPAVEFKTNTPMTFYTTYNGGKFSGLSTQFPKVMQNYYVDPSQLLQNPQYQTAGLTQDHYRPHGSQLEQRVIPVLVLRIPSSYLKNPTAELYPNLPQNYPLSQHLNSVNLQELVNQYFTKMGYSSAPQVMSYLNQMATQIDTSGSSGAHQAPQSYSSPYIRPLYTQADYSGVQYSAVQPVMAKYPSVGQGYYSSQSARQPNHYQYQVQHSQPSSQAAQQYYTQPRYQYQSQQYDQLSHNADLNTGEYAALQYSEEASTSKYGTPSEQVNSTPTPAPQYDVSEGAAQYASNEDFSQHQTSAPVHEYSTPSSEYSSGLAHAQAQIQTPDYQFQYEYQFPKQEVSSHQYYTPQVSQQTAKEIYASYPAQNSESNDNSYATLAHSSAGATQYEAQKQVTENTSEESLVLTENYPSKDHTQATVLPYKSFNSQSNPVQSISYVTPVPYTQNYQSKYRMMVPQTIFKHTSEKVHYVNSQSLPESAVQIRYHGQNNPEEEYTVSPTYIPPVSRQKPPSYPRNYHSHPKRNTRPVHKDNVLLIRKTIEKRDEKKA